jgi:hypothetical protein
MLLDRLGYEDLSQLLDGAERRTFLRLVPSLWRLAGQPPPDGEPPGGIAALLGAMLRVPVAARAAITEVRFHPEECSGLGKRHSRLGDSWVLGAGAEEAGSCVAVVIDGLRPADESRLTQAGWVGKAAGGGLDPTAKLRALADCVCPAWLTIHWSISRLAAAPSDEWVLGEVRLGKGSRLGRGSQG